MPNSLTKMYSNGCCLGGKARSLLRAHPNLFATTSHATCHVHLASFVAMVSRKKAKGKARRAVKEAKVEAEEAQEEGKEQNALGAQMQRLTIGKLLGKSDAAEQTTCRHGLALASHEERLYGDMVMAFQEGYDAKWQSGEKCMVTCFGEGIKAIEKKFNIWNDATKLGRLVSCYVQIATNCILAGEVQGARVTSSFAYFFEQHIAVYCEKTQHMMKWPRIAELHFGDLHTLVKFLRKRIPCKCLDKKYKQVKSMTKMGVCGNPACSLPDRKVAQNKMSYCSGCHELCYCSNACQKVDWPRHKVECKRVAREKAEFDAKQQFLQSK